MSFRGGKERWGRGGWLPEARGSQLDEGQFEQGLGFRFYMRISER
jgi:hypothetical protein